MNHREVKLTKAKSLPKYPEIELGAEICKKLKEIYFADIPWMKCHGDVSKKFTELKCKSRKFYSGMTDVQMLMSLKDFPNIELKEILEVGD